MKKITVKNRQNLENTDPILIKINAEGKQLAIDERKLRHTRDIKIPREIESNHKKRDKNQRQYEKRYKELGIKI